MVEEVIIKIIVIIIIEKNYWNLILTKDFLTNFIDSQVLNQLFFINFEVTLKTAFEA